MADKNKENAEDYDASIVQDVPEQDEEQEQAESSERTDETEDEQEEERYDGQEPGQGHEYAFGDHGRRTALRRRRAGWREVRPVPWAICCRHETPVATTSVALEASSTAGNRKAQRVTDRRANSKGRRSDPRK